MGMLNRFKDIMSSNINAMLDKAENPEKNDRSIFEEFEQRFR